MTTDVRDRQRRRPGPKPAFLAERLAAQIDSSLLDGCWPWRGDCSDSGYGRIRVGSAADGTRRMELAHRVKWRITFGDIPDGLDVLHKCDNPPCCRPDHLFLGTNADNMRDRDAKGRGTPPPHYVGELHPRAKLTANDVATIRTLVASGASQSALGRQFGVTHSAIGRIVRGTGWK
jgi:hypothetical protein